MKPKMVAVVLICALAGLTACARSVSAASSSATTGALLPSAATSAPALPTATYAGPISKPATMSAVGVTLDVPTSQPKISWEQAYDTCRSGDSVCDLKSPAVLSVALATSPDTGQASKTDSSSIVPLMDHTLVYLITQTGVLCSPHLPPPAPGATPTAAPVSSCTFVNFVDATSGKVLYSSQGPTSAQ